MYYVINYETVPSEFHRIPEVYPRHRAFVDEFALGGEISMIGTFGDPLTEGAMCVFRTRDAAERFVAADPFVVEGLVNPTRIREWDPLEYPAAP